MSDKYLNDKQTNEIAFKIIALLDGIPIGHARFILKEEDTLLLDTHVVDLKNPQFKIKAKHFGIPGSFFDQ